MKKLQTILCLFIFLLLTGTAFGQAKIDRGSSGSMTYPGAGIPVTDGAQWLSSYTFSTNTSLGTSDTVISSQNAVKSYVDAKVSDTAYNATTWDAVTTIAPSKNAIRDYLESRMPSCTDGTCGIGLTNNSAAFTPTTGDFYTEINHIPFFIVGATQNTIPLGPAAGQITFAGPSAARTVTLPDAAFTVAKNDGSNLTLGSQAIGDILYASSTTAYTRLADVAINQPLLSGGVGAAPGYAGYYFSGTAAATYTFPAASKTLAANDGSNLTIASQAIGDLLVASSTTAYGRLADVAVGTPLVSGGVGAAPTYGTTNIKGYMGAGANPQTQSSATAGVACDWSLGSTCEISLAASSTAMAVTSSNAVVGQVYRIAFIEPGANPSNGYTPTYSGATVHWVGGTALVLSTTINYVDYMTCYVRTGPIFDCGTGLAAH